LLLSGSFLFRFLTGEKKIIIATASTSTIQSPKGYHIIWKFISSY
jgi:hypothetical protein